MKKLVRTWVIIGILICAAFAGGYALAGGYQLSAYSQIGPRPTTAGLTAAELMDLISEGKLTIIGTVPEHPKRIISMAAACTVVIYDIGAENLIVGVDKFSIDYVPKAIEKTVVGTSYNPSLEIMVGLEPDLIIAWHYARISPLEENIPIIYIDPRSIHDILLTMKMIGFVVGRENEVAQVVSGIENRMAVIEKKIENISKENRPLVYYELKGMGKTVGPGTFTNEMIFVAGGINIASDEPVRYPILSSEHIIWKNPDVIVVVSYGADVEEIKNRGGWQEIDAVKNNRVYKIEYGWASATPRIILGLEQFAKWLHPTLFE